MNRLNLHLIRIFKIVADMKNFTRAAEVLYISQPSVSKSVQELEQQLGLVLIDRSTRRFTLTEAGACLYKHAQQLFVIERAAIIEIEQIQSLESGALFVCASHTTGAYLLPACLADFHQRYPGVRLDMKIANTQTVVEQVLSAACDIGFVEGPVHSEEVSVTKWRRDHLVVIASPYHPLARRSSIPVSTILEQPMIMRETGSGSRQIVEDFFNRSGRKIQSLLELNSNQAVKQAIIVGLGLGFVSELTIQSELTSGQIVMLDVKDFTLTRDLSYVLRQNQPHSPVLRKFLPLLTKLDNQVD